MDTNDIMKELLEYTRSTIEANPDYGFLSESDKKKVMDNSLGTVKFQFEDVIRNIKHSIPDYIFQKRFK